MCLLQVLGRVDVEEGVPVRIKRLPFRFGHFAACAWIALGLGIVLLLAAALRLAELRASRAG